MNNKVQIYIYLILQKLKYLLLAVLSILLILIILYLFIGIKNKNFSELQFYHTQYKNNTTPEITYISINKILSITNKSKESQIKQDAINFLISHINRYPNDVNNGYYSLQLGYLYEQLNILPSAVFYYKRAANFNPSPSYLKQEKQNTSLLAASKILEPQFENIISPLQIITYGNILLKKYYSSISPSLIYLALGQSYDKLGQWDDAYNAYRNFLRYNTNKAFAKEEKTEAYFRLARKNADMSHRIWDTPEDAQASVRRALYNRSYRLLTQLRAPKFFMAHWQEDILDSNAHIPRFRIEVVLNRSNLHMQKNFSSISTQNIKYWKTTGWERVSTWTFVFRKIYQPDKPMIHEKWEWAGIYLSIGDNIYSTN